MVRNNKSTQVLAERRRAQRTSKVEVSEQIPAPHTQQKGYAEEIKKKKNQSLYLHPRLASSWGPDWYLCVLIFSTSCQNLAAHLSRMLRMISSFPVGLSDRVLYL